MPFLGFLQSQSLATRVFFVLLCAVTIFALKEPIFPSNGYFPIDFKYFWLSGQIWMDGHAPYGEAFDALGADTFPDEKINPFFYPPNWWPFASLTALLDVRTAENLWALASASALGIAAWQLAALSDVVRRAIGHWRLFVLTLFVLVVFSHSATIALHIGQPTLFLLCAFTTLLQALRDQNRTVLTLALVFLLLKPQFSLPLSFALFVCLSWARIPVLIAGFVTGILALIGLGLSAPVEAFGQFLANVELYNGFRENWPIHMAGPVFGFALLGLPEMSAFVWLGLCFLCVLGIAGIARQQDLNLDERALSVDLAILVAAITVFLMPTHNPDTLLVMPALLLLERGQFLERVMLLVGATLLMRAFSLSTMLDGIVFAEKTVWVGLFDTAGTLLLACACVALFLKSRSART